MASDQLNRQEQEVQLLEMDQEQETKQNGGGDGAWRKNGDEKQPLQSSNLPEFFSEWSRSHARHVEQLHEALVGPQGGRSSEDELRGLIQQNVQDYREYYEAKRVAVKENVFEVLNPLWKSSLETAFMWMGGWRPSAAFQIALSQANGSSTTNNKNTSKNTISVSDTQGGGGEVEDRHDILDDGANKPSKLGGVALSGVSSEQWLKVEEDKAWTRNAEDQISARAAELQKSIADGYVVKVAQGLEYINATIAAAKLQGMMRERVEKLCDLLLEADQLRYASLLKMVNNLTPVQAAQYLITTEVLKVAFNQVGELKAKKAASEDAAAAAAPVPGS